MNSRSESDSKSGLMLSSWSDSWQQATWTEDVFQFFPLASFCILSLSDALVSSCSGSELTRCCGDSQIYGGTRVGGGLDYGFML